MPRAHRHRIPGQVWHIAGRCHRRQFRLKFARDRRRWVSWLYPEGGTDPIGRMAADIEPLGADAVEAFFVSNAELLLPA